MTQETVARWIGTALARDAGVKTVFGSMRATAGIGASSFREVIR